ncbi:hexokinase-2 [Massariosphaeria phaeospora]|uniref:Phosphotransferase n=1 Tax=Massariosphaeria phaeospora TaxID=100035 RepID=A0A7C8I8J0_9PLEO|nr:hexokinase-2 [Massariosphaeria phaeospora]
MSIESTGAQAITALTNFINEDKLLDLASRFSDTYRHLAKTSEEHFLVTPVTALPTGKEKGKFLSIDVGGTNLRVGFVELMGEIEKDAKDERSQPVQKIRRSHEKNWPIEEHLKMDQAEDLFTWIGDCISNVIKDALSDTPVTESVESPFGQELLLGITFSFPMEQTRLSEAKLLPMGKGFAMSCDLNLGKMLLAGYARHLVEPRLNGQTVGGDENPSNKRRKLSRLPRLRIAAITNDTVATFTSLAYAVKAAPNSRVAMGLIVGTGTNATVPMKIQELHPSKKKYLADPENVDMVVINTEWTIRGTDQPLVDLNIKTKWDLEISEKCETPHFQPFEYMTAGRYLGEIVRLVFVDLISNDPGAQLPPALGKKNAVPTKFLSEVLARADDGTLIRELEKNYASSQSAFWTSTKVELIRDIAHAVQQRSAALIAAACVGLLDCVHDISLDRKEKTGVIEIRDELHQHGELELEELVIAYAGGTISQYPGWLETCQRWIDTLVAKGSPSNATKRVVLREALDGGIVGAGVLAGMTDNIA